MKVAQDDLAIGVGVERGTQAKPMADRPIDQGIDPLGGISHGRPIRDVVRRKQHDTDVGPKRDRGAGPIEHFGDKAVVVGEEDRAGLSDGQQLEVEGGLEKIGCRPAEDGNAQSVLAMCVLGCGVDNARQQTTEGQVGAVVGRGACLHKKLGERFAVSALCSELFNFGR
jgi:hypothetical protein